MERQLTHDLKDIIEYFTLPLPTFEIELPKDPTLYDVIDASLWDGGEAFVADALAPLLVLSLHSRTQPNREIDVPEDLYLDRYWSHNELAIRDLRHERSTAIEQIRAFELQAKKLRSCSSLKGTAMFEMDGSEVLQTAIKMLKDRNSLIGDHEVDGDEERVAQGDDVLTKLESLSARVTSRLDGMAAEPRVHGVY